MNIKSLTILAVTLPILLTTLVNAQVIYSNNFDNLDGFTISPVTPDANAGVLITPFGAGNGMQIYETQAATGAASSFTEFNGSGVTSAFRMDFDFNDNSIHASTFAVVQFGLSNPGSSPISTTATPFYFQFRSDNRLRLFTGDGNPFSPTLSAGPHSLSIIVNPSTTETFSYDALNGSGERTLAAASFDLYIDGVIVGAESDGYAFNSPVGYNSAFGFGSFGWVTGVNPDGIDVDYTFANLEITSMIPESSTSAIMLGAVAFTLCLFARRRRIAGQ